MIAAQQFTNGYQIGDLDARPRGRPEMTSSVRSERSTPSWTAPVALFIAVIAVGLAVWSLLRAPEEAAHSTEGSPAAGAPQSGDAKSGICAAVDTVRNAVSKQTNADFGPDPIAREAVAANARLATVGGGSYLLARLNPAIPAELADAVRTFADGLQDIGMKQLAGIPNTDPAVSDQLKAAQAASARITDLCK
jgi:hypothetical protein